MEHFKEVPDVNRLIISPLYLREGLEFAKNQGYNDILISTDDIGISGVSCKHTLNVSLICEYDFIETLIISGYDFTIEPCNLNQLSVLPHLKKLGLWIDKVFTIDFSLFPKLEELKYYHTKQTENIPYHYLFTLLVLWSSLFTKSQSRYFAARPFGLV